jgi:release factor glutamine methyltransferase
MILQQLKIYFSNELSGIYPSEESNSFFTILGRKYLGISRLEAALKPDKNISEAILEKYIKAIDRLKNFEPIQYIVGETEFYGLLFQVNEHTLIPRPETEELVDWIIDDYKSGAIKPLNILDIGTGSGCIAISLEKYLKNSKVDALDISAAAINVAKLNAATCNSHVSFIHQDILNVKSLPKQYDLIVSNPPYVRENERTKMAVNVLRYEPDSALFVSDEDPLVFYRTIAKLGWNALAIGGLLYFEINEYLSVDLVEMLRDEGYKDVVVKKDIFGKNRMIKCSKNE